MAYAHPTGTESVPHSVSFPAPVFGPRDSRHSQERKPALALQPQPQPLPQRAVGRILLPEKQWTGESRLESQAQVVLLVLDFLSKNRELDEEDRKACYDVFANEEHDWYALLFLLLLISDPAYARCYADDECTSQRETIHWHRFLSNIQHSFELFLDAQCASERPNDVLPWSSTPDSQTDPDRLCRFPDLYFLQLHLRSCYMHRGWIARAL